MKKEKGFTLAEALIVLVIIGVIAALTVPAVLISTEQNEYKTAFKKAISTINEAIQMNIALNGEGPDVAVTMSTPTDESSLFNMIRQRMSVISTTSDYSKGGTSNYAFFTADGMRFEFPETPSVNGGTFASGNSECGNPDEGNDPCLIVVDVNGEKKPNPRAGGGSYKVPDPNSSKSRFYDVYPVIVTDRNAYPYGVVAQRAFFQAD